MDLRLSQAGAVLLAGAVVVLSWQAGYRPAARAYQRDRARAMTLKDRIAQAEAMVRPSGGEAAWLARHRQELERLKAAFPRQSQLPQLLNTLVDTLKASGLELRDIAQGHLEPVQKQDQPLLIDGTPCHRLPVTVTVDGTYHTVVATVQRITGEGFPGVVALGGVELRRTPLTEDTLSATLRLLLYVTVEPQASSPNA